MWVETLADRVEWPHLVIICFSPPWGMKVTQESRPKFMFVKPYM